MADRIATAVNSGAGDTCPFTNSAPSAVPDHVPPQLVADFGREFPSRPVCIATPGGSRGHVDRSIFKQVMVYDNTFILSAIMELSPRRFLAQT